MKGTRASRYPHLAETALVFVERDAAERIRFINEPHWIGYPAALKLIKELDELLQFPTRDRMPNVLLVGEPGNGKTTIIKRFEERSGKAYQNERGDPVRPLIVAQAPPSADLKALYISLLECFWSTYRASAPVPKLHYQLVHLMRTNHVRMLVIDEIHSMLTGTPNKLRETMNAIKTLCNELCIPIVGVGTRDAMRVLHSDPQHATRFDVRSLQTWAADEKFQALVKSFERLLPLQKPSELWSRESAKRLHFICEGNIGSLSRLLSLCAREAIETGVECITPQIVEKHKWIRSKNGIRELVL